LHPKVICFDQRVCRFDELAHDGYDGDLCGLSSGAQVFILCLEIGIVAIEKMSLSPIGKIDRKALNEILNEDLS